MDSHSSTTIEVTIDADDWSAEVTDIEGLCRRAALAALETRQATERPVEMSILLTDDAAIRELNRTWRGQDKPTNVLSFPVGDEDFAVPDEAPLPLGDVIVALETVRVEAHADGKAVADHLAHLVVHGTLHLMGFDHLSPEEADEMETVERLVLASIGIADPYAGSEPVPVDQRP